MLIDIDNLLPEDLDLDTLTRDASAAPLASDPPNSAASPKLTASKQPAYPRPKLHRGKGNWGSGSDHARGYSSLYHVNDGNLPQPVSQPGKTPATIHD